MNLGAVAESVVATAGVAILHATVLAAFTKVVCRVGGRRIPPSLAAVLWTIVLVKLFVPPVLPGEFTLSGGLSSVAINSDPNALTSWEWIASRGKSSSASSLSPGATAPGSPIAVVLLALYLAGFLMVVPKSLSGSIRTWRRVRALPRAPREVVDEVGSLARRIGLRRAPEVLTSAADTSPFVAGIGKPVLVVPQSILEATLPISREPLLLHELAHLRRGDLWVRLLQNAARLVYYFWPPVWWEVWESCPAPIWVISTRFLRRFMAARPISPVRTWRIRRRCFCQP